MQLKPSYDILIFLNFNIAKTNTTVKIVHLYDKDTFMQMKILLTHIGLQCPCNS